MKYSYKWLKELSRTKKSSEELAKMVNLKGFEFEGNKKMAERYDNFCVGKIVSIKVHPNADRLQITKVKLEAGKNKKNTVAQIVCGAKNIQVGDWVPVARLGAVVLKNKMKIEATKIRGVESRGMLCAEDELMLGKSHDGILILEREGKKNSLVAVKKLKLGMALAEALKMDDEILEFSILPNRAHDCLSHIGLAREICAMENRKFKIENSALEIKSPNQKILEVHIKDKKRCSRYIGAVLESVKVKPSPNWLQKRLLAAGMDPINNVVDITNYVMLEVGNPLHAFDFSQIQDSSDQTVKITVRRAKEQEKLELLDGKKIELIEDDLVIANNEKALALAGIKGGKNSGIGLETNKIVLEAANFCSFWIRKTRQRYGLNTESQMRFEKGLSPSLAEMAMARAIELLEKYAEAKLVQVIDENYYQFQKQALMLDFSKVKKLLGQEIKFNQGRKILENLGFFTRKKGAGKLETVTPDWRLDIEGVNDLVEEIGRVVGYEKVASAALTASVMVPRENKKRLLEWEVKDLMTSQGFDELRNYSFYSKKDALILGINEKEHWRIIAPSSEDLALMRRGLMPMMLRKTKENTRYFDEFKLFELARVYQKNEKGEPVEELKLMATIFNKKLSAEDLFYQIKGVAENIFDMLKIKKIYFQEGKNEAAFFQVGQEAIISANKKKIGRLGIVNSGIAMKYALKKPTALLDLDFEFLFKLAKKQGRKKYQPLHKFPLVLRDISLFVPEFLTVESVEKKITQIAGKMLQKIELFDIFFDKRANQKSLAFHLSFGCNNRTLTGEEADELMKKIINDLNKVKLKARVR